MTIADLLDAVRTHRAKITTHRCVRYRISIVGAEHPAIFITIDDEGHAIDANYFVDEEGNELVLDDTEDQAIAGAIATNERENTPTSLQWPPTT